MIIFKTDQYQHQTEPCWQSVWVLYPRYKGNWLWRWTRGVLDVIKKITVGYVGVAGLNWYIQEGRLFRVTVYLAARYDTHR